MTVVIVSLMYTFAVFWIIAIGILYKSMSLLIIGILYMNVRFTESIPQSEVSGGPKILGGVQMYNFASKIQLL